MSTLAEIEAAAESLPPEQKQELMLFLATRLRSQRAVMTEPRKFSREQMTTWIAEDEADLHAYDTAKLKVTADLNAGRSTTLADHRSHHSSK